MVKDMVSICDDLFILPVVLTDKHADVKPCMGNLLSLGVKMCIWNLTEGRSRNCDFKCNLGTYFCGVWIVFM